MQQGQACSVIDVAAVSGTLPFCLRKKPVYSPCLGVKLPE